MGGVCRVISGLLLVTSVANAAEQPPLTAQDVTPAVRNIDRPFYPEHARSRGVEGRASVLCDIGQKGKFTGCRALEEDPKGCGFGDALVKLASSMSVPDRTKAGAPTSGRQYSFTLYFKLPSGEPARAGSC